MSSRFSAGFGRASITYFEPEQCLFGYGDPEQRPEGVDQELLARACVLEERATGKRVVYVVCDLGMVSESVRQHVVAQLCNEHFQLSEHDLLLTATHTHCGPGGYSAYPFYGISMPGTSRQVHDGVVLGICQAVQQALARLRPARAWWLSGWLPASEPVAFNRSVAAYNRNPDAAPVTWERRDEAVERILTVLRVDDEQGRPLGLVSWFPVHGTSLHSHIKRLHGDNKGYAARDCEGAWREQGFPEFTALFSQESPGDVSPNYRWCPRRRLMVGRYEDDHQSAEHNGNIQARHTRELWRRAREAGSELSGPVSTAIRYLDFNERPAAARFAGNEDARTGLPQLGLPFCVGTLEGHGPLFQFRTLFARLARLNAARKRRTPQGNKLPFLDLAGGERTKLFGALPAKNAALRLFPFGFQKFYERALERGLSWVPRYLPIQQLRIGSLLVAGLPNEPTTVAARRMRRTLREAWAGEGVEHAVVVGFSNAYCSYLTTAEEYAEQAYEGASNLYGKHSLVVFQSELWNLALDMRAGRAQQSLGQPPPPLDLGWCDE